jgi:allantoin racemase
MKIHVVAPITTPGLSTAEDFAPFARPDTEVGHSILTEGPPSVESRLDEALAAPGVLVRALQAERDGADAVLIDCMGDPGLAAAREVTSTLVLGPAQTALHVASLLAQNFSVVTTSRAVIPMLQDLLEQYGLAARCRSIRAVDVPVLSLGDEDRLRAGLEHESLRAVEEDGAHAIVFGCTGMRGWAEHLSAHLADKGHEGIPVIDPALTTLKIAEALVDLGLTPSERSYPTPDSGKGVAGYEELSQALGG